MTTKAECEEILSVYNKWHKEVENQMYILEYKSRRVYNKRWDGRGYVRHDKVWRELARLWATHEFHKAKAKHYIGLQLGIPRLVVFPGEASFEMECRDKGEYWSFKLVDWRMISEHNERYGLNLPIPLDRDFLHQLIRYQTETLEFVPESAVRNKENMMRMNHASLLKMIGDSFNAVDYLCERLRLFLEEDCFFLESCTMMRDDGNLFPAALVDVDDPRYHVHGFWDVDEIRSTVEQFVAPIRLQLKEPPRYNFDLAQQDLIALRRDSWRLDSWQF